MQTNPHIKKALAVGIILLFVGTYTIPSTAQETEKPLPTSRGQWLYVGGSGPGNYTRIQDAINHAFYGNTVFVFHNLSPYHENIIIKKSINLIGENKNNTVIIGDGDNNTIEIRANRVNVSGFNIKNPHWPAIGILISSNFNIISDNNISGFSGLSKGIELSSAFYNNISNNIIDNTYGGNIYLTHSAHNSIFKNTIRYTTGEYSHGGGLYMEYSSSNKIIRNLIEHCDGVFMGKSNRNFLYENSIVNCTANGDASFSILLSHFNIIYKNNISHNPRYGIVLYFCIGNQIISNNFLFNHEDAYFYNGFFNHWFGNYWEQPTTLPKMINGSLLFYFPINLFRFDIHPALFPIYIPPAGCDT